MKRTAPKTNYFTHWVGLFSSTVVLTACGTAAVVPDGSNLLLDGSVQDTTISGDSSTQNPDGNNSTTTDSTPGDAPTLDTPVIVDDAGDIDLDGGTVEPDGATTDATTVRDTGNVSDTGTDAGSTCNNEVNGPARRVGCVTTVPRMTGGNIPAGQYTLINVQRVSATCGDGGLLGTFTNVGSAMNISSRFVTVFQRVRSIQTGSIINPGSPVTFRENGGITVQNSTITFNVTCPTGTGQRTGTYSVIPGDAGPTRLLVNVTENNVNWLYEYSL